MTHWSERREGGSRFWLKLIRWIILHIGRGFARLWIYPTTLYFFLRRGPERRASRVWLSRALGRPAGHGAVMRHIFTFAMTIVDRVLLLAGRVDALDIRTQGYDRLHKTLKQGRGCLLLGSHLGSFEASRVSSARQAPEFQLKIVMDRQQNALMTELMEELDPAIAETVIEARQPGPAIALAISEALSDGAMVALLADRAHPGEATVQVPFMGQVAHFPTAPLRIAAALGVPVFLVFGLFEGGRRYRLVFEHFAERIEIPRREREAQLNAWMTRYACRLEHHARAHPYNWFNFYDFWADDAAAKAQN